MADIHLSDDACDRLVASRDTIDAARLRDAAVVDAGGRLCDELLTQLVCDGSSVQPTARNRRRGLGAGRRRVVSAASIAAAVAVAVLALVAFTAGRWRGSGWAARSAHGVGGRRAQPGRAGSAADHERGARSGPVRVREGQDQVGGRRRHPHGGHPATDLERVATDVGDQERLVPRRRLWARTDRPRIDRISHAPRSRDRPRARDDARATDGLGLRASSTARLHQGLS